MSNKKELFLQILSQDKINQAEFENACFQGVPDGSGLRSTCWKILLNYLPFCTSDWDDVLTKQRNAYNQFIRTMIVDPNQSQDISDHPLSTSTNSTWSEYFKENEVLSQIDKDVRRLCPDLSFFQQPTKFPASFCSQSLRTRVEQANLQAMQVTQSKAGGSQLIKPKKKYSDDDCYQILPQGQEAHWEVCERILHIFALLNPGIAYVQGMNEILGPIYYTFVTDSKESEVQHAEADAFFCFTGLMSEIKDNFIKILDNSQCGITHNMDSLMTMLHQNDPQLHDAITERGIKPQFFSFRWLTLLLSQEFLYPEIQRLWDSFFADSDRFKFLLYFCCAMLVAQRTRLINGDFIDNMKVLQRYPIETDIYQLLQLACQIKDGKLILHTVPTKENPVVPHNSSSGRSGILGSLFSRAKNR